jgi:ferrochelatase
MSLLPPARPVPAPLQGSAAGRIGVLLVNLGTPDNTGYPAVRRYLSEFLSDRRVIEVNPLLWQPLLQGVILATRPFRSGAAYRRIWNRERDESPLRSVTRAQAEMLRGAYVQDGRLVIDWAMRYGTPSIGSRIDALVAQGCERVLVVPLYPQYSATTTATVNDAAFRALLRLRRQPALRTAAAFPDHPAYISALATSIRQSLAGLDWQPELLLASFHGLPRRYAAAGDPYPRDCSRTMRALREELGLPKAAFPMTFQSRFGREPWLQPYTDAFVAALSGQGIRRLAVITPGFMADCIETLDEIGNELREDFLAAGGESFHRIPCLNDGPGAASLLQAILREELAGWV